MGDFENEHYYLIKKYFETSLDALIAGDESRGLFDINSRTDGTEIDKTEEHKITADLLLEIYELIDKPKFFTDRQRQVLFLTFGWHNKRYVGPKNVSEIAKILGVAQSVIFNHMKLAVLKLKQHFNISNSDSVI